jgi:hypothetical protein
VPAFEDVHRADTPKRYVWKKKGEEILAKITKARAMLTATQSL